MNEGKKSHDYLNANKAVDKQNPVPKMNLEMLSAMCNIESHVTSVSWNRCFIKVQKQINALDVVYYNVYEMKSFTFKILN